MAEALKVFKNVVGSTSTLSTSITENIVTTSASEQAVIKTITYDVTDPTYTMTVTTKLDGFPLATTSINGKSQFIGSQIVDKSSTLELEISSGPDLVSYGTMEAIWADFSGNMYRLTNPMITSENYANLDYLDLTSTSLGKATVQGTSYHAFTVRISGVTYFATSKNDKLYIYDVDGNLQDTWTWPTTIFHAATDGTYYYGKGSNTTIIYRLNVSNGVNAGNLNHSYIIAPSNSNSGFFEYYNGFLYTRPNGNTHYIYKIGVTGGTTSIGSNGEYENLGALITTNLAGLAFIVEHQDTRFVITELAGFTTKQTTNSSFPTYPTTTYAGTTLLHLGAGIIIVVNPTYNTLAIIDVNPSTATMTNITHSDLDIAHIQSMYASRPLVAQDPVPRDITYSVYADGIEITGV